MAKPITQHEFGECLRDGQLALTLIGMSNTGKSHWSNQLATEGGFGQFCVDDIIETRLESVLKGLGYSGIADIAKWLGQPHEDRFAAHQAMYLNHEVEVMEHIISLLERDGLERNTVIDTTGSVVHTNPKICQKIVSLTTVVYLEATPSMQTAMFELFMTQPKPVVWGELYSPKNNEPPSQTLARCYPQLLAYRSSLYEKMADVTIPKPTLLGMSCVDTFLSYVSESLPTDL